MKNTKNTTVEFEKLFTTIESFFGESKHPSLHHYINDNLKEQLSVYITSELLKSANSRQYLPTLRRIILHHDFRIVGDYLRAIVLNDSVAINNIEKLDDQNPNYRAINHNRFVGFSTLLNKPNRKINFVNKIENLFNTRKNDSITMFLSGEEEKPHILKLINETKGYLGEYIDSNIDLEGVNSLVRKGLVKKIQITKSEIAVTKRNNPNKKGRFQKELVNTQRMLDILNLRNSDAKIVLPKDITSKRSATLKMLRPFAVFFDPLTGNHYSITKFQKGKTLEEVLLVTTNTEKRREYFNNIRAILECLYKNGIVWGDMAPRNIIVDEDEKNIAYHILDFEKTQLMHGEVPFKDRVEHARGPMCVEEFGTICTREEVEEIFKGYFEPTKWDLYTKARVPFIKPKREVVDMLVNGEKTDYTLGAYNSLERGIMEVRFPYKGNNGEMLYPIHASFKIDHYIGSKYDRKTTELFIKSKSYGLFEKVILILTNALEVVDNDFILDDLKSAINGEIGVLNKKESNSLKLLKNLIDALYNVQNKEELIVRMSSSFMTTTAQNFSQ